MGAAARPSKVSAHVWALAESFRRLLILKLECAPAVLSKLPPCPVKSGPTSQITKVLHQQAASATDSVSHSSSLLQRLGHALLPSCQQLTASRHRWRGGNKEQGGGNSNGWARFSSAFGFAAAALMGSPLVAHAEAKPAQPSLRESAASAKTRLLEVWGHVEHELDRQKAQLPANFQFGTPTPPQVEANDSSITVTLPLHPAADFSSVMSRVLEMIQQEQGAVSIKSHQYGASRSVAFERTPASFRKGVDGASLRVQLFVPSRCENAQGEITVYKSEALSESEIEGLAAVLQQANTLVPGAALDGNVYFDPWMGRMRDGWEQGLDVFEHFGHEVEGLFQFMHRADSLFRRFMHEFDSATKEADSNSAHAVEFPPPSDSFPSSPFGSPSPSMDTLPPPQMHRPRAGPSVPFPSGAARAPTRAHDAEKAKKQAAVNKLQSMGAKVFLPEAKEKMDWGILAGYETQKREIEDCLLLPLKHPQVYDKVAAATRTTPGTNRPRAVLFEGPPGTGKTTSARVMSCQAALPLVYLPLEAVVSKWYGESEQHLSNVFKACEALGGCILFLDELDALAMSRDGDIHEASRRLLSVLLREMDGFDTSRRAIVIGATNRKQDLDAALLSRFDMLVNFGLPDEKCRQLILKQYAKQLSDKEIAELAAWSPGLSGRDLRDVCEQTERRWASKIIRGEVEEDKLPTLSEYLESASERLHSGQHQLLPYGLSPQQPAQNL